MGEGPGLVGEGPGLVAESCTSPVVPLCHAKPVQLTEVGTGHDALATNAGGEGGGGKGQSPHVARHSMRA